MTHRTIPAGDWRKSSYSQGNGGDCVEWAPAQIPATGEVPVRDSKDPQGPALPLPFHFHLHEAFIPYK